MSDGDPDCVVSRVGDGEQLPASIDVAPPSHESFPTRGCDTGVAFENTFVRFIPEAPLEPSSTYRIQCNGDFDFEYGEFITSDRMASPAPELVVEDIGVEEWCDLKRLMRLDIRRLDPSFWEEGGVIIAEYENGAIDWVGMAPDSGPVFLELPEVGDEVVTLTVVNGAGLAGPPLELDVTEIAGSRGLEGGCSIGGVPRSFFLLSLCLLLRGRSRRLGSRCGAAA
jgi:hypothetical protein